MSRTRLWLTAILVLFALPTGAQTSADVVTQADALFAELWGTQYTLSDAPDLRALLVGIIDLYKEALELDDANTHILNMLARCYYMLADVFLPRAEKGAAYAKGQQYGEESMRLQSDPKHVVEWTRRDPFLAAVRELDDVEAIFWTYGNWARRVQLGGALELLAAVTRGDDVKLRAMMDRCMELDRGYVAGGPLRALAGYWAEHPIPFTRDHEKAGALLEEAIANFPDYLENRVFYVQYYLIPTSRWAQAREEIQKIIDAPIGEDALENGYAKILALDLLTTVESKLP